MLLHATRTIEAPRARLWQLLTDTRLWPEWGPSIKAVSSTDTIICQGTRGSVEIALLPISMPFVITEFEPMSSWSWKVAGQQATTHTLQELDDRLCQVSFGIPSPLFLPYLAVCHRALKKIEALA